MSAHPTCSEVIEAIQDYLPALYFTFSRGRTELLAEELAAEWDFLTPKEKREVRRLIQIAEEENPGLFTSRRYRLKTLLQQGIGYHHAGLPPALKDLVERLYEKRLVYVLFCTETFAVGVNFPAASTVFDSCRKWDGQEFRGLMNREFFQMAGRAGRRGFDEVGRVFVRIDERFPAETGFFRESEVEPVRGRLVVSPNTVLSLLHYKTDEEIQKFLNFNLAVYQRDRQLYRLRRELAELQEEEKRLKAVFCPHLDTPPCHLFRLRLKRELNSLTRRRKRGRPGSKERRAEIRKLLKMAPRRCPFKACVDAEHRLAVVRERIKAINRQIDFLSENTQDYHAEFRRMWRLLEKLGYVEGRELLPRGRFALEVHVQELLVTELVFSGVLQAAEPAEAAAILAGVDYRPGRDEYVVGGKYNLKEVGVLRRTLLKSGVPEHMCVWSALPGPLATAWYEGATFEELLEMTSLEEGDIFSLMRREIDLLRQIERAAFNIGDVALRRMAEEMRRKLDRDEVALLGI